MSNVCPSLFHCHHHIDPIHSSYCGCAYSVYWSSLQVYYKRALARVEENREKYHQLLQAAMQQTPEGGEGQGEETDIKQPSLLTEQICKDLMASFHAALQDTPPGVDHTPGSDGEGDSSGDTSPHEDIPSPQEATPPQRTMGTGPISFSFNVNAPAFKPSFDLDSLPD